MRINEKDIIMLHVLNAFPLNKFIPISKAIPEVRLKIVECGGKHCNDAEISVVINQLFKHKLIIIEDGQVIKKTRTPDVSLYVSLLSTNNNFPFKYSFTG